MREALRLPAYRRLLAAYALNEIGGAITALASPRVALAVAGAGALLITVTAWTVLGTRTALQQVA